MKPFVADAAVPSLVQITEATCACKSANTGRKLVTLSLWTVGIVKAVEAAMLVNRCIGKVRYTSLIAIIAPLYGKQW